MALDTYANLKTTLQTWMARADLSSDVDDMIDMFEGWVNRNLRVPQMEQEATSLVAEYVALPTDFIQLRDIQYQGSPRKQLEYMSPSMADIYDTTGSSGTPGFYTIVGDQLRIIPAPDNTSVLLRIDYWKKIPALGAGQASNWLLALYPDAYLYGPFIHGAVRVHDPEMAQFISQGWTNIMREVQLSGKNANIGSLLRVRVA